MMLMFMLTGAAHAEQDVTPGRESELRQLVLHDCGACHGMTLNGGLGPSLSAESLANRDVAELREVILNGRDNTAMPPWKQLLSDAEAAWIVQQLQDGGLVSR